MVNPNKNHRHQTSNCLPARCLDRLHLVAQPLWSKTLGASGWDERGAMLCCATWKDMGWVPYQGWQNRNYRWPCLVGDIGRAGDKCQMLWPAPWQTQKQKQNHPRHPTLSMEEASKIFQDRKCGCVVFWDGRQSEALCPVDLSGGFHPVFQSVSPCVQVRQTNTVRHHLKMWKFPKKSGHTGSKRSEVSLVFTWIGMTMRTMTQSTLSTAPNDQIHSGARLDIIGTMPSWAQMKHRTANLPSQFVMLFVASVFGKKHENCRSSYH